MEAGPGVRSRHSEVGQRQRHCVSSLSWWGGTLPHSHHFSQSGATASPDASHNRVPPWDRKTSHGPAWRSSCSGPGPSLTWLMLAQHQFTSTERELRPNVCVCPQVCVCTATLCVRVCVCVPPSLCTAECVCVWPSVCAPPSLCMCVPISVCVSGSPSSLGILPLSTFLFYLSSNMSRGSETKSCGLQMRT